MPGGVKIEVLRQHLTEERADQVLDFWTRSGAFQGEPARDRLPSVVCVAVDDTGEVVGANSVEDRMLPSVGRRFWVYRTLLTEDSEELASAMFNAAFEALAEEFEGGDAGPIGLCLVVEDHETMARHPEAIWPQTELVFAGYLPDDRQLRLRYFWGATVGPGAFDASNIDQLASRDYPIDDRIEIVPLAESDSVTADDVLALWSREGVVADEVARQRIEQVQLVAVADGSEPVGVSWGLSSSRTSARSAIVIAGTPSGSSPSSSSSPMQSFGSVSRTLISRSLRRSCGLQGIATAPIRKQASMASTHSIRLPTRVMTASPRPTPRAAIAPERPALRAINSP